MSDTGFTFRVAGVAGSDDTFTVTSPGSFRTYTGLRIENAQGAIVKLDPEQMAEVMAAVSVLERADPFHIPDGNPVRFSAKVHLQSLRDSVLLAEQRASVELDLLGDRSIADLFTDVFEVLGAGARAGIIAGLSLSGTVWVPMAVLAGALTTAASRLQNADQEEIQQVLWAATEMYANLALGTPNQSRFHDQIPAEARVAFDGSGVQAAIDFLDSIDNGQVASLAEIRSFEGTFLNAAVVPDLAKQFQEIAVSFQNGRPIFEDVETPIVSRLAFLSDFFLTRGGGPAVAGSVVDMLSSVHVIVQDFANRDTVADFAEVTRGVSDRLDGIAGSRFFSSGNLQDLANIAAVLPLQGTVGADHLIGSSESDEILGLGGSDTIDAGAGLDEITIGSLSRGDVVRVSGGFGRDQVTLPGIEQEYQQSTQGSETVLTGRGAVVSLESVEEIRFAAEATPFAGFQFTACSETVIT